MELSITSTSILDCSCEKLGIRVFPMHTKFAIFSNLLSLVQDSKGENVYYSAGLLGPYCRFRVGKLAISTKILIADKVISKQL